MRLLRIEMQGFRCYVEPTVVEFHAGLNVFCGANEAGKSALMQAIQHALYLPRMEAERLACLAEGQDLCRTALEYGLPDRSRYRLERDLVAHRHALSRWDGHAWSPVGTQLTDIARAVQRHTGCDQVLFERTLLVRHEAIEVPASDDLTTALAARLELLIGGQGRVSAAKAADKLEQKLKALTGPRAGEIAIAEGRLEQAQHRLALAQQRQLDLDISRGSLAQLEERIRSLEEEFRTTGAVLDRHRRVDELEELRDEKSAHRQDIDRALDARDEARRWESDMRELEVRRPLPAPAAASVSWWASAVGLGAALVVGGVVATILWQPLGGLASLAGLALMWLGWFRRSRRSPADAELVTFERRVRELEHQFVAAKARAETLSIKDDGELKTRRSELRRDLEELETRIREEATYRLVPEEVERRKARMRELPDELLGTKEQRAVLDSKVREAERDAGRVVELEDDMGELERRLTSLRLRADAIALAHDELQAAIGEVRDGVGPRIAEAATKHLQAVVASYAVTLIHGKGLTFLPMWSDGRPFGRRALSDGTADQFYFAVRVALAEVLLGDLRPPMILDDPFQYCDPARQAELHGLLRKLAEERQVLYFTVDEPAGLVVTHSMPLRTGGDVAGRPAAGHPASA